MKIEYTLKQEDYLEHQLFAASISPRVNKQRIRAKFFIPALMLVVGVFMCVAEKNFLPMIGFICISLLWFFLYPFRDRQRYKTHYTKYVKETFGSQMERQTVVEFEGDFVSARSGESESRMHVNEINEIYELKHIFLLRLKTGNFILPKSGMENLGSFLRELAVKYGIPFSERADWKWK